jgi:hypothetical protein
MNSLNATNGGESKDLLKSRTSINNNNILNNTVSNFAKKTTFDNNGSLSGNTFQNLGNSIMYSNSNKNIIPGFKGNNIPVNTSYSSPNIINTSMIKSRGNLRSAMDSLDLIVEHDEREIDNLIANNINNTDLFKNSKNNFKSNAKERYKETNDLSQKLDEVNLFTKTIMSNNDWGNSYPKLGNNSKELVENMTHFKPHKKEIEKEIGKSILNTKLPRARLSTKAIETQNFNKIHKSSYKTDTSGDGDKAFNSTALSFMKPSAFSKAFSQILGRKNN